MRTLEKNKIPIWYSNTKIETEEVDNEGNFTGNIISEYVVPVKSKMNFYPANGEIIRDVFGNAEDGDMVSVMMGNPFTKDTILFLSEPTEDYSDKYDYKIKDMKPSLNSTYYLWRKRL